MKFHVDTDLGSEISLWIAPDHPDKVPRISIWDGQRCVATMDANVMRDDVRQIGMHSTGQVGFSITSDIVFDIERVAELMIIVEGEETNDDQRLLVYCRPGVSLSNGQRLLILDTGRNRTGAFWTSTLAQYAQIYQNLDILNLETLLSVLGNELAPSIGAVGFPHLSRVRSILESLDYRIIMMFRDPMIELAQQIDYRIAVQDSIPSNSAGAKGYTVDRRALLTILREMSENETFELSNPVMRRLTKDPGEQVSSRDVTTALRQLAQFDLVMTDQTRDLLSAQGDSDLKLPSIPTITERQGKIADHLRHIGIAADIIAEDLELYDRTSAAITSAYGNLLMRHGGKK